MKDKNSLFLKIDNLLQNKNNIIIGIDGRAAAGKTTLAQEIASKYDSQIICADHFFLPLEKRTKMRLATAGENFDWERFVLQVKNNLPFTKEFSYDVFDCKVMNYNKQIKIRKSQIYIIEGSYCMHNAIRDIYDLKIFVDVDKRSQKKRIILRNGPNQYNDFKEKWIPLEEKYFLKYGIKELCDIVF